MFRLLVLLALAACGCRDWVRDWEAKANAPADQRWHDRGLASSDGRPKSLDLFSPPDR